MLALDLIGSGVDVRCELGVVLLANLLTGLVQRLRQDAQAAGRSILLRGDLFRCLLTCRIDQAAGFVCCPGSAQLSL